MGVDCARGMVKGARSSSGNEFHISPAMPAAMSHESGIWRLMGSSMVRARESVTDDPIYRLKLRAPQRARILTGTHCHSRRIAA